MDLSLAKSAERSYFARKKTSDARFGRWFWVEPRRVAAAGAYEFDGGPHGHAARALGGGFGGSGRGCGGVFSSGCGGRFFGLVCGAPGERASVSVAGRPCVFGFGCVLSFLGKTAPTFPRNRCPGRSCVCQRFDNQRVQLVGCAVLDFLLRLVAAGRLAFRRLL